MSAPRVIKLATRDADGVSKRRVQTLLLATSPAPEAPAPEPLKRARASRAVGVARGRVGVQERRGGAGTPVGCSRHQRRRRSKPGHARVGPGPDDSGLGGRRGGWKQPLEPSGRLRVSRLTADGVTSWLVAQSVPRLGPRAPTAAGGAASRATRATTRGGAGLGCVGRMHLGPAGATRQTRSGVGRWQGRGRTSRRPVCVSVQARARGTLQEHLEAAVLAPDERL